MSIHCSLFLCWMAAAVSISTSIPPHVISALPPSLCPEFNYEPGHEIGQWSGNLRIQSEDDLHGVWIRVVFDREIKELTTDGGFETIQEDNRKEVLIKNRNVMLKAMSPKNLRIAVKYDGSRVPNLIEYRLNARTICPEHNANRLDYFQGDAKSQDFLSTVLTNVQQNTQKLQHYCDRKQSPNNKTPYWQASLFINQGNKEKYICEATLVDPTHVLTSAHCVTFNNENTIVPTKFISLYLGENGASKYAQRVTVTNITLHPGYESGTLFNDLAVLKLSSAIQINDFVRPICLNAESSTRGNAVFGYDLTSDGQIGQKLLEASIRKISGAECFNEAPYLEHILGDDSYCYKYTSDENCVGNSGSSVVSLKDNVATLKGVISLGIKLQNKNDCNHNNVIVVTDISRYLKWIQRVLVWRDKFSPEF